jgi:branched-chain amino acid transport system permease protein
MATGRARARLPLGLTWVRLAQFVITVVVVIVLVQIPQQYGETQTRLITQGLYLAVAAMGLNLLTGYNGQVSIGHGAFYGLGAYATAILMKDHGWDYFATLPVAMALCFAVGAVIGFPALRVKGLYLALLTLGLAALFPDLVLRFVKGTGGTPLVQPPARELARPEWADFMKSYATFPDQWHYYVTLFFAGLMLLVMWGLVRARFGRALIAVRDHEAAASTVGINPARVKVSAFAISALYAGLAGSLSVQVTGLANADKLETFRLSIEFLVAVVIGGTATVLGPLLGALVVVFLDDQTRDLISGKEVLSPAVFGITLIVLMYFLPDGVVGGARRLAAASLRVFRRRRLQSSTT